MMKWFKKLGRRVYIDQVVANSCRDRLVSWNKMEFGHVRRKIAGLQKQLQSLEL